MAAGTRVGARSIACAPPSSRVKPSPLPSICWRTCSAIKPTCWSRSCATRPNRLTSSKIRSSPARPASAVRSSARYAACSSACSGCSHEAGFFRTLVLIVLLYAAVAVALWARRRL
jgi:hypothetical protein